MKLKNLGFEKKIQRLFQLGTVKKPAPKESPLLKHETLPNTDNQCPPWLQAFHQGEQLFRDAFIKGRQASNITVV